jgi:type II secretory pathway pseudopilin PulG
VQILNRLRDFFGKSVALLFVGVCLASACGAQTALDPRASQQDWAQQLEAKYPGLLAEFQHLFELWKHDIASPGPRAESQLLPLLPEGTMSYAAIPNYGGTASQVLAVFRQELKESSVLREWWKQGQVAAIGPKIEDSLDKFSQLSQYLGDEISISGTMEGREPNLLIVVEIRKPGLKKFLQQMITEVAGKMKSGVRVLEPQELAAIETKPGAGELLILVRPDYVVGALDAATLRKFNARLDQAGRGFVATPFGHRVEQAYAGGVTTVAAADMQKILQQVPPGPHPEQMPLQRSGFSDMKYLVWERTRLNGQTLSQAELSFTGPRRSAAAWLAKPAPLGSLDFVSPKAILVSTLILANPARIFDDVKEIASASNANAFASIAQMEQVLKLSLRDDVLNCLGGEITLELDSITPPKPAWKAILKVSDTKHLQQTLNSLLTTTQFRTEEFEEGGVTISTLTIPSAQTPITIGYAFVDGYLIIGSAREKAAEAIRLHSSGGSLGKSRKFLAALPPGHAAEASALFYQDPIAMASLQLQRLSPAMAESLAQASSGGTPTLVTLYGEESAIREASRGGDFDVATVLVVAAIAIPNLLRSKIAANEASAVGMTRTVNTAEITYQAAYPKRGYAPDLASLGPNPRQPNTQSPEHADFINETLGNASCTGAAWCTKSGYQFRLTAACKLHLCTEYVVVAAPIDANTGTRSFCSTSDCVIHFKTDRPLTAPVSVAECRAWTPLR